MLYKVTEGGRLFNENAAPVWRDEGMYTGQPTQEVCASDAKRDVYQLFTAVCSSLQISTIFYVDPMRCMLSDNELIVIIKL